MTKTGDIHTSLPGVNLSLFDVPVAPVADCPPKPVDLSALVRIRQISTGQQILLCTVSPAPATALAEAKRLDLPLFTADEIPNMRRFIEMTPEEIQKVLDIKRTFPGCSIYKHEVIA